MPKTKEELNRRKSRAKLWHEFCEDFLVTQRQLAAMLGISRRTVQYVMAGEVTPSKKIQSLFETMAKKHYAERNAARKKKSEVTA